MNIQENKTLLITKNETSTLPKLNEMFLPLVESARQVEHEKNGSQHYWTDKGKPEVFNRYTVNLNGEIESLYLTHSSNINWELLKKCLHLKHLTILHSEIYTIHESILRLPSLTSLDLSDNSITNLPEFFNENLRHLSISRNNISKIDNDLSSLSKLVSLSLEGNKLTVIPQGINNLSNLRGLNLNRNNLKNLPSSIEKQIGRAHV